MAVRVIGIGNPQRGDDAAGHCVIAALAADPPPGCELATARGDMLALFERWAEADAVILVDAMAPGETPGRITRIDAGRAVISPVLDNFVSSHVFNLAETIELARALGRLPRRLTVFGIEGATFIAGGALSAAVAAALPELIRCVREECTACTKLP
jgi:hydrogenase maturation protease